MTEQQICDSIRRNLTEQDMVNALENAGIAATETGHDLVIALCEVIQAGDIPLSVATGE